MDKKNKLFQKKLLIILIFNKQLNKYLILHILYIYIYVY